MEVLYIDDEPLIRKGLRVIIPWSKYGFTEFFEAESGMEGLEIILKYNLYIRISITIRKSIVIYFLWIRYHGTPVATLIHLT